MISTFRIVWCLSARKNQLHPSLLFWHIVQFLQTCCFGYFGHPWLWPVISILPACKKHWCLSSCKKSCLSLISFLRHNKDIANLLFWVLWTCLATNNKSNSTNTELAMNILGSNSWSWQRKAKNQTFILHFLKENQNDKIFRQCKIRYFWAVFAQILPKRNFPQKPGSVTFYHL